MLDVGVDGSMVDTWEGELKERWEDGAVEVNVLSRQLAW